MKRPAITVLTSLLLSGCPLGTPNDHYRPDGHSDITIDVSADADEVLFNATGSGGRDLYLLSLADKTIRRIAETPEYETAACFSPDGRTIVYSAGVSDDRADHIFTIGRNGTAKMQLTNVDANDTAPRFSPNGRKIVFARDITYQWGGLSPNWELGGVICIINADGTNERELTSADQFAFEPWFSADGRSVLYLTMSGVWSISLNEGAIAEKIGPPISDVSYNADRTQVVHSHGNYSYDFELFVGTVNGKEVKKITSSDQGCFAPVIAADGKHVYFLMESWPDGPSGAPSFSIYSVAFDGNDQKPLTDATLFDDPTNWDPKE